MSIMNANDPSKPDPGYVMRPTLRKALDESIEETRELLRMLAKR